MLKCKIFLKFFVLSVVMLCKWRHHPNGGGGVVSAGYTALYVPEYEPVDCISHNKQHPSCIPEENLISLGVKSGERESSDRVFSANPLGWKLSV